MRHIGEPSAEAFSRLLSCCDPNSLTHISFVHEDGVRPLPPTFFTELESRAPALRYLELGGLQGAFHNYKREDYAPLDRIAKLGRALEEVVLPLQLDIESDDVHDLIFDFAALPQMRAIRVDRMPRLSTSIHDHGDDEKGKDTIERENRMRSRGRVAMRGLASFLLRQIALRRGEEIDIPMLAFGDARGGAVVTAKGAWPRYDEPMYFRYCGGRKSGEDDWMKEWKPMARIQGEGFRIFVPDPETAEG